MKTKIKIPTLTLSLVLALSMCVQLNGQNLLNNPESVI